MTMIFTILSAVPIVSYAESTSFTMLPVCGDGYVDADNNPVTDMKPLDTPYYCYGNETGTVIFTHKSTESNYSGVEHLSNYYGYNDNMVLKCRNSKGTEIVYQPKADLVTGKYTTLTYRYFSVSNGFIATVYYDGKTETVDMPDEGYGDFDQGTVTPFVIGTYYNLEKVVLAGTGTGDTVFNSMIFDVSDTATNPGETDEPDPTVSPEATSTPTVVPTATPTVEPEIPADPDLTLYPAPLNRTGVWSELDQANVNGAEGTEKLGTYSYSDEAAGSVIFNFASNVNDPKFETFDQNGYFGLARILKFRNATGTTLSYVPSGLINGADYKIIYNYATINGEWSAAISAVVTYDNGKTDSKVVAPTGFSKGYGYCDVIPVEIGEYKDIENITLSIDGGGDVVIYSMSFTQVSADVSVDPEIVEVSVNTDKLTSETLAEKAFVAFAKLNNIAPSAATEFGIIFASGEEEIDETSAKSGEKYKAYGALSDGSYSIKLTNGEGTTDHLSAQHMGFIPYVVTEKGTFYGAFIKIK